MAVYGKSTISNKLGYKGHEVVLTNASIEANRVTINNALKILSANSYNLESKAKADFYQQAKSRGFIEPAETNKVALSRRSVSISTLSSNGGNYMYFHKYLYKPFR